MPEADLRMSQFLCCMLDSARITLSFVIQGVVE